MASNVSRYKSKIEKLLESFLPGKTEKQIDQQIDTFLQRLRKQEEKELEYSLLSLPVFTEWLKNAISTWSASGATPQPCIISFALNLTTLLAKKEERFGALNSNNFFIKLINLSKSREPLAYIQLLEVLLEHKSGLEWMVCSNFWEDVFQTSLSNQSDEIVAASTVFMAKLLEKTVTFDEKFAEGVVKLIMVPLGEKIFKSLTDSWGLVDEGGSQYLKPTLKLIGSVLERRLADLYFGGKDLKVILLFVKHFCLGEAVTKFSSLAQTEGMAYEIGKVIFIMEFLEIYIKMLAKRTTAAEMATSLKRIKNNFALSVSRGTFEDVIEFCHFGQLYWSLVDAKIPKFKTNSSRDSLPLANQLIIVQLMPNFFLISQYYSSRDKIFEVLHEDFRDDFQDKLFNMLNQDMMRALYHSRLNLMTRMEDLFELSIHSITRAKNSLKYFTRERAIVVFQSLIYNLKDFTQSVRETPEKFGKLVQETTSFVLNLELLVLFLERFDITWKDSIEAMDIMAVSFDFLTLPRWSTEIIVQDLKLINVALVKYLAPTMVLLVDSTADSTIALLGPLLYAKLYDEAWEVKKEVLEVIRTMALMAGDNLEYSLLSLPVFAEWIKDAVGAWSASGVTPQPCIISFTLGLATLLGRKQAGFESLNCNNFFIKLINISRYQTCVRPAYVKFLEAVLEHKSGLEWTVSCNFWEDVFQMSLSEEIAAESTMFMTKLLTKTVRFDEKFAEGVVKRIMVPLGEKMFKSLTESSSWGLVDEGASQYLKPTLKLIGNILEQCLDDLYFGRNDLKVVLLFVKHLCLEQVVAKFTSMTHTEDMSYEVGKVMFIMEFLGLYIKMLAKKITAAEVAKSLKSIKSTFALTVSKGSFEDVIEFCHFGQLYWSLVDAKIPKFKTNSYRDSLPLADQLVIVQLLPNFTLISKYYSSRAKIIEVLHEDLRDDFHQKIIQMCEDMMRAFYLARLSIMNRRDDLFSLNIHSLTRIKGSLKYFSKERAIAVFQSLIYNMKDFTQSVKETPEKFGKLVHETSSFTLVLELLVLLLERFDITWKDSLEAMDIMAVSFDFLTLPRWSTEIIVQALKLINVALVKYLAPTMALLVDSTADSTIALLGPLLYAKLYDEAWEVEREVLEVVCTMARIAGDSKYQTGKHQVLHMCYIRSGFGCLYM